MRTNSDTDKKKKNFLISKHKDEQTEYAMHISTSQCDKTEWLLGCELISKAKHSFSALK